MSGPRPVPQVVAPGPAPRDRRPWQIFLTVLAWPAQVVVVLATFLMGLGWGGPTYLAALAQAALAFVPLAWLTARRSSRVVLVPVLSAALSVGLALAAQALGRATACSDAETAAVEQLAAPPGTTVTFRGDYTEGCVAWATMALPNRDIVEHYRAEFARLGWRETPGRQEMTFGTAAVTDGVQVTVDIEDEGGQVLEVVVGDPASATPCQVNRVGFDASMPRDPTSEVEPGRWVMLVSAPDPPASVVIRDGAGAVVFRGSAQARPDDDADDLMQLALPTLPLDEGNHTVECRPGDGAGTTVPLSVGWAPPGPTQRERSVVLRVTEVPGG